MITWLVRINCGFLIFICPSSRHRLVFFEGEDSFRFQCVAVEGCSSRGRRVVSCKKCLVVSLRAFSASGKEITFADGIDAI